MYKKLFENKKAILFDLDGTIVETLSFWFKAYHAVYENLHGNQHYIDLQGIVHGRSAAQIWEDILKIYEVEEKVTIKELVQQTNQKVIEAVNAYQPQIEGEEFDAKEGFWSFTLELKKRNYKIGLVSNSDRVVVEAILKKLNIPQGFFDVTIAGDEVKNKKPHPEMYLEILKRLALKADQVLAFEDSTTGASAAVRAKIDTVVIWNGEVYQGLYPTKVLEFTTDFAVYPQNMDHTYLEKAREQVKRLEQETL